MSQAELDVFNGMLEDAAHLSLQEKNLLTDDQLKFLIQTTECLLNYFDIRGVRFTLISSHLREELKMLSRFKALLRRKTS